MIKLFDVFTKGIIETDEPPSNVERLISAFDVRLTPNGAFPQQLPELPLDLAADFPYPQIFVGRRIVLAAYDETIYEITPNATFENWSSGVVSIVESDWSTEFVIPSGGGLWSFAEVGDFWVLCKDGCLIYNDTSMAHTGVSDMIIGIAESRFSICCSQHGRLFIGGLGSDLFGSHWQQFLEYWVGKSPVQFNIDVAIDSGYVMWSDVQDVSMLGFLRDWSRTFGVLPEDTTKSLDASFFMDLLTKNGWGMIPIGFYGAVKNLIPLGNDVLAYCASGVARLSAIMDPIPGYSVRKSDLPGVQHNYRVCGTSSVHYLIDNYGHLVRITEQGAENLGYKYYLDGMLSEISVMFLDTVRNILYICASYNGTFVLYGNSASRSTGIYTQGAMCNGKCITVEVTETRDTPILTIAYQTPDSGKLVWLRSIRLIGTWSLDATISFTVNYKLIEDIVYTQQVFDSDISGIVHLGIYAEAFYIIINISTNEDLNLNALSINIEPVLQEDGL